MCYAQFFSYPHKKWNCEMAGGFYAGVGTPVATTLSAPISFVGIFTAMGIGTKSTCLHEPYPESHVLLTLFRYEC